MGQYFTNEKLPSNIQKKTVLIKDKKFTFNTDNGVFCKKGLDFGSRTLINTLLSLDISGKILDLGCGVGTIGIILSSFFDIDVDFVDVNKRALHLTEMNIKENKTKKTNCFISDAYENITEKYNVIITNPPIRAGKKVVYKMLFEAKDYLKEKGQLFFVINKNQGAKSTIADLEKIATVSILEKYKGFYVISCIFD